MKKICLSFLLPVLALLLLARCGGAAAEQTVPAGEEETQITGASDPEDLTAGPAEEPAASPAPSVFDPQPDGVWYVTDGKEQTHVTGVVTAHGESRYVVNGRVDETFSGALISRGAEWIVHRGSARRVTTPEQHTLFLAYGEVEKATAPGMTKEEKLSACFVYCKSQYREHRPRTPHYLGVDWPVIYANDMFAGTGGNCFSYAAAFAFMAKAIGYTDVYACNSSGHGWAEIDGLVYDPEWSKRDGLDAVTYFGVSYDERCDVLYRSAIERGEPWMRVYID